MIRNFLVSGGPIMYVLYALSAINLAVLLERTWFWVAYNKNNKNEITENSRPVKKASQLKNKGIETELAVELALEQQETELTANLQLLGCIIVIAPLLGILGTVTGIILSFRGIDPAAGGDVSQVTGGLSVALLTTATGLVIALIATLLHFLFQGMAEKEYAKIKETLFTEIQDARPAMEKKNAGKKKKK